MDKEHKEESKTEVKKTDSDEKLEILSQSLLREKEKADAYYAQIISMKAEFENYRKRNEKEIKNSILTERKNIFTAFLPVMDNLLRIKESNIL